MLISIFLFQNFNITTVNDITSPCCPIYKLIFCGTFAIFKDNTYFIIFIKKITIKSNKNALKILYIINIIFYLFHTLLDVNLKFLIRYLFFMYILFNISFG